MVARVCALLLMGLLTMPTLINHNYEGGETLATLGYTNVSSLANTSGAGLRGSTWGLLPSGTASDKYYSEATHAVTHDGRSFSIEADFDHSESDDNGGGYHAFDLTATGGFSFLSLYHGVGADRSQLQLYLDGSFSAAWTSATGVVAPDTTQKLKICGTWSSDNATANGTVSVYVDGTLIHTLANVLFFPLDGEWLALKIGAMGRFDNLLVTDVGCAPPPEAALLVKNSADSCCTEPQVGPTGSAGNVLPPDPFIAPPAWVPACTGGGLPPTAADPTHSEDWSGA